MRKDIANHYIDEAAGEARSKYISSGVGQESTYLFKSFQAKEFKAVGYLGPVPTLIQVEVDVTGLTPQEAADYIITTETKWVQVLSMIEKIRRSGKIRIESLVEPEEISQACEEILEILKTF